VDQTVWQLIRASGLTAAVLLTIAVAMGVSLNVRALDSLVKRAWVYEVHQFVALLCLMMVGLHLLLVALNRHVPINLLESLIPLASPWRPTAIALGTLGLYLSLVLVLSSYFKSAIGHRTWRIIHYGGFLGWAAAMLHGLAAGSDTGTVWVQYVYLAEFALVAFLTTFRVLAPSRLVRPSAETR